MTTFPLPLSELLGHWGAYVVFALIGVAFGYALEIAGFGNSRKLAAQFYFKDMTVLKVMFTGIIVAMVLIFTASSLGLLDYNLVWVNPTYLWPGIVGGLIMGAGFIIGGFCPGTSLVAVATAKIDGIFFTLGVLFGVFMFGETVSNFEGFWNSSYMGRFTLPDWLGLETGTVVLLVVLMALFMFWGSEQLERIFGGMEPKKAPKWRYGAAGALVIVSIALIAVGQPTTEDRWQTIAAEKSEILSERAVQIDPGELLELLHDTKLKPMMIDVRDEANFNLFHILDAKNVPQAELPNVIADLHMEPANAVFIVMSNDEAAATEAWKTLQAESVPNVYILGGGINGWLDQFAGDEFKAQYAVTAAGQDQLQFAFDAALGSRHAAAEPDPHQFELNFVPKVELELKRAPTSGGCG